MDTAVSASAAVPSLSPEAIVETRRIPGIDPARVSYFETHDLSLKKMVKDDPIFAALQSKWPDKQHIGRLSYEAMLLHGSVAGPMNALTNYLKSYRPQYHPPNANATERQKMFADFLNDQLNRLGQDGDPRQGYSQLMEWFCQGLTYGFVLAEMETVVEYWNEKPRIQVNRILPLPQASLDAGLVPRAEYGENLWSNFDVRYRCFQMDPVGGRITAVTQYFQHSTDQAAVTWAGPELQRILHYAHRGGQGNPFGESILLPAWPHWSSLYVLEAMEEAFLDAGLPYLTFSYKTPDGRPSPAMHQQVLDTIRQQDPQLRAFIMADTTFGSVSPSNPNFTEHAFRRKSELRSYISNSIFGQAPSQSDAEVSQQSNIRELLGMFSRNILPSLLEEFASVLTWQFGKRLIDSNWTNVKTSDYPRVSFTTVLNDELRVSLPLLQMLIPYIDSDRLGEFAQTMIPSFDAAWIPQSHKQSVALQREMPDPASGNQRGGETPKTPGGKAPGTPDTNPTGSTSNPSSAN
jgi:hypothetical protein